MKPSKLPQPQTFLRSYHSLQQGLTIPSRLSIPHSILYHPPAQAVLQIRTSRLPITRTNLNQPLSTCHYFSSTPTTLSQSSSKTRTLQPFLLADIGEGITGCEIVKWLVTPGQTVAEFDPIAEVQSDKATVEITSPYDGIVESLVGQTGQVVKVGEPLCMILVDSEPVLQQPSPPENYQEQEQDQFDSLVKTKANQIKEDDPVAHDHPLSASNQDDQRVQVHSTPAVRRLAREHQLDITTIRGTGKEGRVTKEDVINHLGQVTDSTSSQQAGRTLTEEPSQPPMKTSRVLKEPFGAVRQAMFRGLTQSLRIPHFGYYDQVDVTELERLRQALVKNHPNSRITLLSLFTKILGKAMIKNELFRSTLSNDDPPQFIKRQSCDISIAVDSPAGLLTPLIPSVESKSVLEIADHITRLRQFISQSSPDKIPRIPDELGGNRSGTLTISNIGIIGGTYTHPVIPPTGQLAIGAIGSIKVRPEYAASDKELAKAYAIDPHSAPTPEFRIEPRLIVEVSFTADHRAVEGVELARLVQTFKQYCQAPSLLLAELV
ncbi:hypothetical protein PGT21_034497 [Puccinia graminis f. sp. tritici]|uniref:Dihydrolipoamide acetyltransferase component of pyruvate dehydrogenase complex n=2 Tax=Puccinia graminis f. sp. tritici TaxID=56615 RepID=A0A5B0R4U1_PUCGR|nr:hypothetical protein PGT21_034497 [Puccinia graminis f. sp. tritici]KAA1120293.1 hypothetical protein PGTUg99_008726 [Puccinia graminis f. sp. tritici]